VTSIALIEHRDILVTASADFTSRAWTYDGKYIGTFGQEKNWDLTDDQSWLHPFIPDDVLVDPTSVPSFDSGQNENSQNSNIKTKRNESIQQNRMWLDQLRKSTQTSNGKRYHTTQKRITVVR